jgi:hypothetical protein
VTHALSASAIIYLTSPYSFLNTMIRCEDGWPRNSYTVSFANSLKQSLLPLRT